MSYVRVLACVRICICMHTCFLCKHAIHRRGNECGAGLGESFGERRVCASSREGKEVTEL